MFAYKQNICQIILQLYWALVVLRHEGIKIQLHFHRNQKLQN